MNLIAFPVDLSAWQVAMRVLCVPTDPYQSKHKRNLEIGNQFRHSGSSPALLQMQDEHAAIVRHD